MPSLAKESVAKKMNNRRISAPFERLISLIVGIVAAYLFSSIAELYVDAFGETYTAVAKLLASSVSMLICCLMIFLINSISLGISPKRLGLFLGLGLFLMLYLIGPGLRAPATLYISAVSFPYNVNMLLTVGIPLLLGWLLARR